MSEFLLKGSGEKLQYQFNFANQVVAPVTMTSVSYVLPAGIVLESQATDTVNKTATAILSGGTHGGVYDVIARALLSSGETVDATCTIRVHDGG